MSIFVSYRRRDTAGHAGRLVDQLREEFGHDRVFQDIDIPPGVDFVEHIGRTIGAARVLIVLIGDDWLTIRDEQGERRLDDPTDFVRTEIRAALQRSLLVIPVLVERASMPAGGDLPEDIRRLSTINALELSDSRWGYDVGRLVDFLRSALPEEPRHGVGLATATTRPRRAGVVVMGIVLLLVLIGGSVWAFTALRDGGNGAGNDTLPGGRGCEPGAGTASITVSPSSGPAGTEIRIRGRGFEAGKEVQVHMQAIPLETLQPDTDGTFAFRVPVPTELANFVGQTFEIIAVQPFTFCEARVDFTVA